MITVTLQEAKAKLNQLVDKAQSGEQVVFMRGARVVATLVPLTSADLEIAPHLSDDQAERFWHEISDKKGKTFLSAAPAVEFLKRNK